MSDDTLRNVVRAVGALFTLLGVRWLLDPAGAAQGLGMPLLEGVARSTQVGDLASFFLVAGLTAILGASPGRAGLLRLPAALIGGAAVTRTLAWLLQGAAFTPSFIAVEVVVGALLLWAASRLADAWPGGR